MDNHLEPRAGLGNSIPMEAQVRTVSPPKSRPVMVIALENVEEAEKNLASRIDLLITRLHPILQIRPKDATNGESQPEICGVQIPDILLNHASTLHAHARQIQEVIDSLAI